MVKSAQKYVLVSGAFSQALYVASNLVLNLMLSRRLSTAGFGNFGVVYLFYTGIVLVFVAATAEVNVALRSSVAALYIYQYRVVLRAALGFTLFSLASAWLISTRDWPVAAAVFSLTLPWFLVHESLRALAASVGSINALLLSDFLWVFVLVCIVEIAGFLGQELTASAVVGAWFLSGVMATLVLAVDAAKRLNAEDRVVVERDLQRLHSQSAADRTRSASDYMVARLGVAMATASVGVFVGAGALGQTRYAQTYFGPLNLVIGGVRFVGLRALDLGKRLLGLGLALLACWAMLTLIALFAPERWWQIAFGGSFSGWGWPLYAVAVARLGAALAVVPLLRARYEGALSAIWNARVWATGIALVCGLVLIGFRRPVEGVWTWLAAEPILAVLLLVIFRLESRPKRAHP